MNFYRKVDDRIKSLSSWEQTIARIDELNELILKALKKRSKYPVCRDYFDITRRRHESNPQRELEAKGIDTIFWGPFYSKIVEKICEEGDFVPGVVEAKIVEKICEAESRLEELIHERDYIGEKVIEYKAPRGMEIERKPREEEIYAYVRQYASENGMNPDAVEEIFRMIIEKNKYIQSLHDSQQDQKLKLISSCRTMAPNKNDPGIGSIKKRLRVQGEMLAEKTGKTYHVVVDEMNDRDIMPVYIVKLVQE